MNKTRRTAFAAFCGLVTVLHLLHATGDAQATTKSLPVTVANTTTNPVPVIGQVNVGTPTVKLDPNNNTVRLERSVNRIDFIGFNHNWAEGQTYVISHLTENYSRLKICVKNAPTSSSNQDVIARVISRNVYTVAFDFELDSLYAPRGGPGNCKVYDFPGYQIIVGIEGPLNTAGTVSVGLWGQPN